MWCVDVAGSEKASHVRVRRRGIQLLVTIYRHLAMGDLFFLLHTNSVCVCSNKRCLLIVVVSSCAEILGQ